MTTYLDLFADSKFFEILSFALLFSYILPFVLSIFIHDSLNSSPAKQRRGPQKPRGAVIAKQAEEPTPFSVKFWICVLYTAIISQFCLTFGIKISHPSHWLFSYPIPNLFRVLGIILVVLFEIVFIWSLLLLPYDLRIKEGYRAPPKLIRSGPYSEVCSSFFSFSTVIVSHFYVNNSQLSLAPPSNLLCTQCYGYDVSFNA